MHVAKSSLAAFAVAIRSAASFARSAFTRVVARVEGGVSQVDRSVTAQPTNSSFGGTTACPEC